jgi:uncharacterized membrane protein
MTQVKFGDWIQKGFDLYKANLATLIVVWLLVAVLSGLTLGVLFGPMACGAILITLALIDGREPKPEIGDVFKGFAFFLQSLLGVVVVFAVCFVGGGILGLVPLFGPILSMLFQLAVSTLTMFAFFLIAERNMEFIPALRLSIDTVKTNFWEFLGLLVVAGAIASVGLVACCVGVFLTQPIAGCIIAVAYREVFGRPAVVAQA